jgi:hypothetical protein
MMSVACANTYHALGISIGAVVGTVVVSILAVNVFMRALPARPPTRARSCFFPLNESYESELFAMDCQKMHLRIIDGF